MDCKRCNSDSLEHLSGVDTLRTERMWAMSIWVGDGVLRFYPFDSRKKESFKKNKGIVAFI